MAGAVERGAGIVDVDAFERGRKSVGIALAPLLAVGDDVEACTLLVADGEQCGVILRLLEIFRRDTPQFLGAYARRKTLRNRGLRIEDCTRMSISNEAFAA